MTSQFARSGRLGRRLASRLLVAFAVCASGGAGAVSDAPQLEQESTPLPIVCMGQSTTTYSPALRAKSRDVSSTNTARYGSCQQGFEFSTATVESTAPQQEVSCGTPFGMSAREVTVEWSTGERSTLLLSFVSLRVDGNTSTALFAGPVISGRFEGYYATRTLHQAHTDVVQEACLSRRGLAETTGRSTLTLVPPGAP